MNAETQQPQEDSVPADQEGSAKSTLPKSVMIPESLRTMQATLLKREAATDEARKARNLEVARLRDEDKVSQYRIAKWLGVTERAVMHMTNAGRELREQKGRAE